MATTSMPAVPSSDVDTIWSPSQFKTISRVNGYNNNAITYIPVCIIGGGASGIALGCRLKSKYNFDQFRIFDRQSGVGGTWWINRYPGVACDIPAVFYSFSFCQNPKWSSLHAPGPELAKYMSDVCNKYGLVDKIQCNTEVEACRWIEEEEYWEVDLMYLVPGAGDLSSKDRRAKMDQDGEASVCISRETIRAKILVSAVGSLVEPKGYPKHIPGFEDFKGEIFHSARWRHDIDFMDKNVVVLGTGCSAAQFVPKLTLPPYQAKSVTQVMRSAPWVVPRVPPPGGEEEYEKWSPTVFTWLPFLMRLWRFFVACYGEYDYRLFGNSEYALRERQKYEKVLLNYLYKTVPKKYHEMLTPDHPAGCKRRIWDPNWFNSLNDPKIELTSQPVTNLSFDSVTLGPGRSYPPTADDVDANQAYPARKVPADVLILANGFEALSFLHPLKVIGRSGADLMDVMASRGGPQAYQGTAMDGFPNFFMIFGPNISTGQSSVILASENQANFAAQLMKLVLDGDARTIEVKREAEEAYTKDIQEKLSGMVWSTGCKNWYVDSKTGWNPSIYPYPQIYFILRCMFPKWDDWNVQYTRKGIIKMYLWRSVAILAVLAIAAILYTTV